jgi:hypothetical protein
MGWPRPQGFIGITLTLKEQRAGTTIFIAFGNAQRKVRVSNFSAATRYIDAKEPHAANDFLFCHLGAVIRKQ